MYGAGMSIAALSRALGLPELTALAWIKKSPAGRSRVRAAGRGTPGGPGSGARGGGHLSGRAGYLSEAAAGAGPAAERYCTDPYPVYRSLLPAERHQIGQGPETNRNEATHEVLRRKLNRLARRTPGYSKSLAMLVDSLALVWLKPGRIQDTCPC